VRSVLTQSIDDVRVLILDDASPDNTAEVAADLLKEDSRIAYRRHTVNKGHIYTYNEGIDWASADYTMILSADDYLLPDALARAATFMDAHSNVGFIFGAAIELHADGTTSLPDSAPDSNQKDGWSILNLSEFIRLSGASNIVRTPTAIVRTQLQKRLGGYRYELPHSGDMEMWLRLASEASVGVLAGYTQAVYRRHHSNMSLGYTRLSDLQQRRAALDIFFQSRSHAVSNADLVRRSLFWLLGCDAVGAASAAFNEGDTGLSEQLANFAIEICPHVKRSVPWIRLSCKRLLGLRLSTALRTAVVRAGGRQRLTTENLTSEQNI
jgi:glycosyltransferase involved in cell wall biosynthesis